MAGGPDGGRFEPGVAGVRLGGAEEGGEEDRGRSRRQAQFLREARGEVLARRLLFDLSSTVGGCVATAIVFLFPLCVFFFGGFSVAPQFRNWRLLD